MPNKRIMPNERRNEKTGRFIHNVVKKEEALEYAANYYDKHKERLDGIIKSTRSKKEVFIDAVDDLFDQNRSKYTSKKSLNEGIRGLINEFQGIDPRLNEIKRDALNREEAGFSDLRKLNKRVSNQEIPYAGPDNIVGYYDIKDSDYVIVHRLDYTYSAKSPMHIYEYMTEVEAGLKKE